MDVESEILPHDIQSECPFSATASRFDTPLPEQSSLVTEAYNYLSLFYKEQVPKEGLSERIAAIQAEIERTGSYTQRYDELAYGARVAWRNSTRCIGRLYWKSLTVRDMRYLTTADEIFEALLEHLRLATNGGRIRSLLTVFAPQEPGEPGIRIWNSQLVRYAGYQLGDGTIIGDPLQLNLTKFVLRQGWRPTRQTPFDILPLIIQMPHEAPRLFSIPPEVILEVPLSHPHYSWFAKLGLKWYAVPVISNMRLELGGLSYTAAPFNGWYMGSEIGARNLGDLQRYNLLPLIADRLGLDMQSERTLWRDRALVELNIAVLDSFQKHGVTMLDHHTATRQFVMHEENERQLGRPCPADWGWIVPPISGSTTPVFHREYKDFTLSPNYLPQLDLLQHDSLLE